MVQVHLGPPSLDPAISIFQALLVNNWHIRAYLFTDGRLANIHGFSQNAKYMDIGAGETRIFVLEG